MLPLGCSLPASESAQEAAGLADICPQRLAGACPRRRGDTAALLLGFWTDTRSHLGHVHQGAPAPPPGSRGGSSPSPKELLNASLPPSPVSWTVGLSRGLAPLWQLLSAPRPSPRPRPAPALTLEGCLSKGTRETAWPIPAPQRETCCVPQGGKARSTPVQPFSCLLPRPTCLLRERGLPFHNRVPPRCLLETCPQLT